MSTTSGTRHFWVTSRSWCALFLCCCFQETVPDEYNRAVEPDGDRRGSSERSAMGDIGCEAGRQPVHLAALDKSGVPDIWVHTASPDKYRLSRHPDRRVRM